MRLGFDEVWVGALQDELEAECHNHLLVAVEEILHSDSIIVPDEVGVGVHVVLDALIEVCAVSRAVMSPCARFYCKLTWVANPQS